MDSVMDVSALQACHLRDEKSPPPKPTTPRDNDGDSILLDTYFDHSRPLDSQAFDDLLATKFGDDQSEASTKTITQWRPAHSIEEPQLHEAATTTKMESFDQYDTHHAIKPPYSALASPVIQQQQMFGLPLHAAPDYQPFQSRRYQPSPYGQQVPTHQLQPQHVPLSNMPSHVGQYYSHSGPVAMPTMGDSYHDMPTSQPHYNEYYSSPENGSRQGTADLVDYDNSIPEEDESGDNVNGEIADPCYAQLLFKCLREAPDHTLSLKQVYEWVRKHSQKARDSSGTGWQNSVRHNLSMNAAFERVTASALHGAKKGSLWRLNSRALQEGVISTTRYRKDPKRKPERRSSPALKRQSAGAKGGQATRAATQYRKAMQARTGGVSNFHGIERHRRDMRRQEPSFFPPTSMPSSTRATASPQPGWMPHGLPTSMPQHNSLPASPYYMQSVETDPFAMMPPPSLSNPHTPNEIHVGFAEPSKASPPTAFGSPSKGLTEFELSYHDHSMGGLFGDDDGFDPNTPSLGTEMSFVTDEMTPLSMRQSVSVEPTRS